MKEGDRYEVSEGDTKRTDSLLLPSDSPRLYRIRWYILLLFSLYSGVNAFQWIQYSIISNIIVKFYGVSTSAADWLSMIFMLLYVPLIFPVTWLLDRHGLRLIAILGSCLQALGAVVKVASCRSDLFAVTMLGQTIASIAQVFILGMPSKLAATWFGKKEVSTACALGVFGNNVGIALGFLLPPIIVPDSEVEEEVEGNLRTLFIVTAVASTFLALVVLLTFKKQPKTPPSLAQANYLSGAHEFEESRSYGESVKTLFRDKPSLLLILSYGVNTGSFYAISTLLNDEILSSFPGAQTEAGQVGLTLVLAGVVGSVICGVVLDKTRAYKKTTVIVYVLTLASSCLYTATLDSGHLWLVYLTGALLGFTMTGYLPVGFEFAAEITYPVCEGISSGLLNASAQIFGIVFTISMRQLMSQTSVLAANITLCAILFVGTILTVLTKEELKRQNANSAQVVTTLKTDQLKPSKTTTTKETGKANQ